MFVRKLIILLFFSANILLNAEELSPIPAHYAQQIIGQFSNQKYHGYLREHVIDNRRFLFITDRHENRPEGREIRKYVLQTCVPDHCALFAEGLAAGTQYHQGVFGLENSTIEALTNVFTNAYLTYTVPTLHSFLLNAMINPKFEQWWLEAQSHGLVDQVPAHLVSKLNQLIEEAHVLIKTDTILSRMIGQKIDMTTNEWRDLYRAMLQAAFIDPSLPENVVKELSPLMETPPKGVEKFFYWIAVKERSAIFAKNLLDQVEHLPKDILIVVNIGNGHYPEVLYLLEHQTLVQTRH